VEFVVIVTAYTETVQVAGRCSPASAAACLALVLLARSRRARNGIVCGGPAITAWVALQEDSVGALSAALCCVDANAGVRTTLRAAPAEP
jgi:hypothetical protein